MADDSHLPYGLPAVACKKMGAAFDGSLISFDDGLVLLHEAEYRLCPGNTPSGVQVSTLIKHVVCRTGVYEGSNLHHSTS